jgi:hypothetical protein
VVQESALYFGSTLSSLKVLPVELAMARGTTSIMTLKKRALSPAAQLFIGTHPRGRRSHDKLCKPSLRVKFGHLATRVAARQEAERIAKTGRSCLNAIHGLRSTPGTAQSAVGG